MSNEFLQMGVTLLFLPLAALAIFYLVVSLRQLATGFRDADTRKQRNAVYLFALCCLGLLLLQKFWFWLMWQLD
ncbi:MAG: hypothetical protein EOO08_07530 [Chitinophagaceae bacterium]|nr:MAG: hypothetical protein EOO08_07530 [Chitinophagaceae bacterium]